MKDEEHDAFYFRSLEEKGIKLNEPQLKATRHFMGPALVLAGALPHKSALDPESRRDIVIKNKEKNMAIEGERRLAYVAITRAEEELYISSPRSYRDEYVEVSRFVMDVFKKTVVEADRTKKPEKQKVRQKRRKSKSHPSERNPVVQEVKQTIMIWECKNESCLKWQRIQSYEETLIETKVCPHCMGMMKHGIREIRET